MMLPIILVSHYLAAFSVLCMPVFLPKTLASLGVVNAQYWIGVLFALPLIAMFIALPLWGRFGDAFGQKISLLRAQFGLFIAFTLAAHADSVIQLAIALVLQGVFGGTLASSNAYIRRFYSTESFARVLYFTQCSARMALFTGPPLVGVALLYMKPLAVYSILSLLPLCSFIVSAIFLKNDVKARSTVKKKSATAPTYSSAMSKTFWLVIGLNCLFHFSVIVGFPYFMHLMQAMGMNNDAIIGGLFSLPHIVVFVGLTAIKKIKISTRYQLLIGFTIIAISSLLHTMEMLSAVIAGRIFLGCGMVLCFNGINHLFSEQVTTHNSGILCGVFESSSKLAAIFAAIFSTIVVAGESKELPFIISIAACFVGVILLVCFERVKTAIFFPVRFTRSNHDASTDK